MFKLGLWSALVFFEHGSEMQLATALVINVLQLCVHIEIKPMGGDDAALLNLMQTCTLVLTTYINFGALAMNYLEVSQTLAHYVDPGSVDEYDASIAAIGLLMQLLTFGLFLSFGGVALGAFLGFVSFLFISLCQRLRMEPEEASLLQAPPARHRPRPSPPREPRHRLRWSCRSCARSARSASPRGG